MYFLLSPSGGGTLLDAEIWFGGRFLVFIGIKMLIVDLYHIFYRDFRWAVVFGI